ncbi:unnamed protein product [Rotaria magnacalcarata]|uniref:Uncharacterized protein n=1 Tax=Rotaria magnacalcarata TaxID=392030 RepID=A0A818X589_9BILA|nr:unnamed protein product [Rotaria magnacalcarata]CAF2121747.1 unnamed protein product [Rotaria magnacalcarata]CAF3735658.1 unnamed protein product [Rotaria magnacalcarata]CAF3791795.1 unnamed protein product [Rotaria magnacalcarata]
MSCECHSSFNGEIEQLMCNSYKNSMFTKIQLTSETKENSRTFDSFHLVFYDHEFNVSAMFLNDLSQLFSRVTSSNRGDKKLTIKVILSFPNFLQLHFEDYSFYQLFGQNSDYRTIFTLELTSNGKITFSSMALSQLTVDQMFIHASSFEPYSFEEIFNNTNIGELTMEGSTPRSNETYRQNFNGRIRSAKFTKMVETVASEEFPPYPVRSMVIEAHEARKINASTFINYKNLHGLHLIRPKFFFDNRTFDGFQYLISLETVELDAETIKDNAFQHVSRIRYLTLGQNTRYLSEHSLDHLDYLVHFDVSKLILDQLYPSSRCVLARFIQKQEKLNPSIAISPPQAEYCDCIYDFILALLNKQAQQSYTDLCSENQQERCQLSQCNVVRNFRFPVKKNSNTDERVLSLDENMLSTTVPLDPTDDIAMAAPHQSPTYVHKLPSVYYQSKTNPKHEHIGSSNTDTETSHVSALKVNKPMDPNEILAYDYDENIDLTSTIVGSHTTANINDEQRQIALKNETLKWISLSLVCITILCILLVVTLIWFFACRPSQRNYKGGFQPVQADATHV